MARSRTRGVLALLLVAAGVMYFADKVLLRDERYTPERFAEIEQAHQNKLKELAEVEARLQGAVSAADKAKREAKAAEDRAKKANSELASQKAEAEAHEEEQKRLQDEIAKLREQAAAASKRAEDAAKQVEEAKRAAEEAKKAAAAAPQPAASGNSNKANSGGGKKPISLGVRDLSQIPGKACCPGDVEDMSDYDFAGTAVVTLATGNEAARNVIALVQSLRDVNTRAESIVVMLSRGGLGSPECRSEDGGAWKRANGRENHHNCAGKDTIAEEIVSPQYVQTLKKLGAQIMVVDEIPSTPYTEGIPGGRGTFWGMALNKLRVFNMTQFKKVIWMDGDTMVLKNVDHLFLHPTFTAAFTYACCNKLAPALPSGGLWILEPSAQLADKLWEMQVLGKPKETGKWGQISIIKKPDGTPEREYWHWGDMQLVRWLFSKWNFQFEKEPLWPEIFDNNHGRVAGMRFLPRYKDMSDEEYARHTRDSYGKPLEEGFTGKSMIAENQLGEQQLVWRALDVRYDQCIGHCDCIPERDMPDTHITVHFSCIQNGIHKPGNYATEREFGEVLYNNAPSCIRYWFWHVWYEKFKRAHGRLAEPHYTGPDIPGYDKAHDEKIKARSLAAGAAR